MEKETTQDSWIASGRSFPGYDACIRINPAFVVPVSAESLQWSVGALADKSFISLEQKVLARLLQREDGQNIPLMLVEEAVAHMEARKAAGSWAEDDQKAFDKLLRARADVNEGRAKPYLVRAVLTFRRTGQFSAYHCRRQLWVFHGALGVSAIRVTRWPVIVFLPEAPSNVFVRYSVAR